MQCHSRNSQKHALHTSIYLSGKSILFERAYNYAVVIRKSPIVSGFCSDRIISLGMSNEALSHCMAIVRSHMKLDLRITISCLLKSKSLLLPNPLIINDMFPTMTSIIIEELSSFRLCFSLSLISQHDLFALTPIIQSPRKVRFGFFVISIVLV